MENAGTALKQTMVFYLASSVIILAVGLLGIWYVWKNSDKPTSGKVGVLSILLLILLAVYLFHSVFPFVSDVQNDNIQVVKGTYINELADKSKSNSSILGFFSVELLVNDQAIHLTTVPCNRDIFIQGTHHVIAYYTGKSKMLLYITLLD